MTMFRSFAIGVFGLGLAFAVPTVADAYLALTTGSVNVRVGPGVGFARIATLPPGAQVDVRYCQPGWCQIGFWNGGGWVSAAYLNAGPRMGPRIYPRRSVPYFRFYFGPGPGPAPGPWPLPAPWPYPPWW
jgi:uncharacterized protein YraI